MADIKWVKIVTDVFDDEKILLIESMPESDSIIVIWFKLLCLAGKQNNSGVFMLNDRIPYTDDMLATIFRRNPATVKLALAAFQQFGMIEIVNDVITIPNWDKHQNIDGLEKIREQARIRTANYRHRQKALTSGDSTCDVTVTRCNALDKIREDKIREDNNILPPYIPPEGEKTKKETKRFIPPTLEEIQTYSQEKGYKADAEGFINYYESNGWKVGKNKMVSWKAALANWNKNNYSQPKKSNHTADLMKALDDF